MDHQLNKISGEEWLMIVGLLVSSVAISACHLISLRPASGAPVVEVSLLNRPGADLPSAINHASRTGEALTQLADAASSSAVTGRLLGVQQAVSRGDDGFIALQTAGTQLAGLQSRSPQTDSGDRAALGSGAGGVSISKIVHVGDRPAGNLEVTVRSSGELFVDGRELRALLRRSDFGTTSTLARGLGDGSYSFRALREAGIEFRYSPDEDVLKITG